MQCRIGFKNNAAYFAYTKKGWVVLRVVFAFLRGEMRVAVVYQ